MGVSGKVFSSEELLQRLYPNEKERTKRNKGNLRVIVFNVRTLLRRETDDPDGHIHKTREGYYIDA